MMNTKHNFSNAFGQNFCSAVLIGLLACISVTAQENAPKEKNGNNEKAKQEKLKLDKNTQLNAEQIAEFAIVVYGSRPGLNQLRRTEIERGKIVRLRTDGTNEDIDYELRRIRGENINRDRLRLNYKSNAVEYALFQNNEDIYGILNDVRFEPRPDITLGFDAMIWNGLEGLLRYKENGSTLNLIGKDKQLGVEYYILEVTDKKGHKTRYNISTKTFRVLSLEYEQKPNAEASAVKYLRRFYDYRVAQGTLVPYRSILFSGDKQIEETTVSTVTFGVKIDDEVFKQS